MAGFTRIASVAEISAGTGKVVEVEGRAVALFNVDGTFHAIDNECLHRGGPLGDGSLSGTTVMCPWHGWEFDVTTGACHTDDSQRVPCFQVKVDGADVLIAL
jgi:nitrite reductase/ring-hydroxylating ferredoxin subunit